MTRLTGAVVVLAVACCGDGTTLPSGAGGSATSASTSTTASTTAGGGQGKPAAGGAWCGLDLGTELVDATTFMCGIAENPWAVTPDAVYGDTLCFID